MVKTPPKKKAFFGKVWRLKGKDLEAFTRSELKKYEFNFLQAENTIHQVYSYLENSLKDQIKLNTIYN